MAALTQPNQVDFIMQALRNEDITVYGEGNQTRSFCYVGDLVDGLLRLMDTPDDVTGPVNLGNPVEFTIRQLAETVIALIGSSSKIVYRPLPEDDPRQRCPDISLAKELLAWEPRIQLRDGLMKTIDYFERLLKPGSTDKDRGNLFKHSQVHPHRTHGLDV